jgi:hypothetical protein
MSHEYLNYAYNNQRMELSLQLLSGIYKLLVINRIQTKTTTKYVIHDTLTIMMRVFASGVVNKHVSLLSHFFFIYKYSPIQIQ